MSNTYSVITRKRRIGLCEITSGKITELPKITKIALGDKGVDTQGNPVVPLETQLKLNNQIAEYEIEKVEYPEETTARYTITIPKDDLPGEKISEAALVDSKGTLCAIRNMYVKQKDVGVAFTFVFDDEY